MINNMSVRKSVTLKVNGELVSKITDFYRVYECENANEYIDFFAKKGDTVITVYSSKKDDVYKVVFMGESSLDEAHIFDENATFNEVKVKTAPKKANWICLTTQFGSDEVGTGDLFGPICVAAALVKESDIARLKELGIDDSKRLTDEKIKELGKILINEFAYSQVALDNEKYNELVDKGLNINEMKCKLHNQVLLNLKKKYPSVKNIFVDQFVSEDKYYKYLSDTKNVVRDITFKTKGESYFPCVAVASIIARYSFLSKMEKLSKKYKREIPFGASKKVTEFAQQFANDFSREELLKITKKNFANLDEVI